MMQADILLCIVQTKNFLAMKRYLFYACLVGIFTSCSFEKKFTKQLVRAENIHQSHIGFMLSTLEGKPLIRYHDDKYFTPGSNTKIFTLFACLNLLKDSVPTFEYFIESDTLFFRGVGDPSFLNPKFQNLNKAYSFLRQSRYQLCYVQNNFFSTHFGPGWSWEDYTYYFSAERAPLPIYGNTFTICQDSSGNIIAEPKFFDPYIHVYSVGTHTTKIERNLASNETFFNKAIFDTSNRWSVPFHTDSSLVRQLLTDTLHRRVSIRPARNRLFIGSKKVYNTLADSLYKHMMQESDNFIAEQLLLLCSRTLSDSIKSEIAIAAVTRNFLNDLPDPPVWKDGSGLSRYNLFTPRSVVKVWQKMHQLVPEERLLGLLATGGISGTLKNYFKSDIPYIYGKTGTLSHVHCLSGFLKAKSGKTLIFSFMYNNYTAPVKTIRLEMESLLKELWKKY